MKKKYKKKLLILIFCIIIATICLFLNSKCSILYPFNGWDDFNTFYTVGRCWANGLIPYKDLFEQKGPLLYLIFMIGYLITPNKFTGIFILEIIFLTITLYISYKITKLFTKNNSYLIIIPLYAAILTTSISFIEGGSSEEFNLLFTTTSIYYIIKHLKKGNLENINYKDLTILGLTCGLSLMIKYTTIGLWFITMAIICLTLIYKKKYKEALKKALIFIISMLTPLIIFSIYFLLNNALNDFINTYFYINIFKYSKNTTIINYIISSYRYFITSIIKNIPTLIITFTFVYYFLLNIFIKQNKIKLTKNKIIFTIITLFTIFILYYAQNYRPYNTLAIYYIILILIIYIFKIIKKKYIINTISIISTITILILNIDYDYIKVKKDQTVQYYFANIIKEYENPTILQYRSIDEGFYTTTQTLPVNKYFDLINISYEDYPEIYEGQDYLLQNKLVDFVIIREYDLNKASETKIIDYKNQLLFNSISKSIYLNYNYELISIYYPKNGYYNTCIYYLYKLKDI